jgi:hypothetical protein
MCRLLLFTAFTTVTVVADDVPIAGSWSGESLCASERGACKDEHVIWTFKAPDSKGHVWISADRVVDGQRINMGASDYDYNREKTTLTWKNQYGVWELRIKGDVIEGSMTLNDGRVVRKMNLKKDKS